MVRTGNMAGPFCISSSKSCRPRSPSRKRISFGCVSVEQIFSTAGRLCAGVFRSPGLACGPALLCSFEDTTAAVGVCGLICACTVLSSMSVGRSFMHACADNETVNGFNLIPPLSLSLSRRVTPAPHSLTPSPSPSPSSFLLPPYLSTFSRRNRRGRPSPRLLREVRDKRRPADSVRDVADTRVRQLWR